MKKLLAGQKSINVGMAEVKMAIVITHTIFVGIFGSATYVKAFSEGESPLDDIEVYLACESRGAGISAGCIRNTPVVNSLIVITQLTIPLFPVIVFFVTFDTRAFKSSLKSIKVR